MKVAAIQMVSGTHLQDNLRAARALLEQAADSGAELAALPEYFCAMGHRDTDKLALREVFGKGVVQDFLARTARDLQLWIVGGTVPLQAATAMLSAASQAMAIPQHTVPLVLALEHARTHREALRQRVDAEPVFRHWLQALASG